MDKFNVNMPSEAAQYINKSRKNFKKLYNKMFEVLSKRDINSILNNTDSRLTENKKIKLSFFEREVIVGLDEKNVYYAGSKNTDREEALDEYSSFLILHYLLNADGTPLTGDWISYRELPGGLFYWKTVPIVLESLVEKFGDKGEKFLKKALKIGGEKYTGFKFGSVIYPFKMFPVLLVIDEKNEEFEASVRILFDRSAPHYLKTDIVKLIIVYIVNRLLS